MATVKYLYVILNLLATVKCTFPPIGDEVQLGSVLLPASRRGRYLANIVRRQAVDGTGIKFNKDADRMNAEAKKKVDVLSEELLPYIITEQERRMTLHRRVMTAIQNGEKGVTIAEIRNKPPLIIRRGLMYRCPANRAPKEPDGSGVLMCEDENVPSQVMYDSCLSAEDRDLYNAENKYFFCNRHRVEGPDLPRNGSTVIGCAPIERTSLNYTINKCTLEDTDDVVVHYRYYPDRVYKFVTELDPDHEVCDHWNPCQIGYIYSLPSLDQAIPASDLWRDVPEKPEEYERDEIVPPVPEDSFEENVPLTSKYYQSSPRKVAMPETSRRTGKVKFAGVLIKSTSNVVKKVPDKHISTHTDGKSITIIISYDKWKPSCYGTYNAIFTINEKEVYKKFLILAPSAANVVTQTVESISGQNLNSSLVPYKCNRCRINGIMVRSKDDNVYNLDSVRYRSKEYSYRGGKQQQFIEVDMVNLQPKDFGDYFLIILNGDGYEERVKILNVQSPELDTGGIVKLPRLKLSCNVGGHYDRTMNYTCEDCEITDILCNGESVLSAGRVSIISVSKMISFNYPRFENSHACVYLGFFKVQGGKVFKKILGVIDNNATSVTIDKVTSLPEQKEGVPFEQTITFSCDDCSVVKVYVNGLHLDAMTRRNMKGSGAFFAATSNSIVIRITEYHSVYSGIYQCLFQTKDGEVTKTIMEIKSVGDTEEGSTEATSTGSNAASTDAGDVTKASEGQANSTENAEPGLATVPDGQEKTGDAVTEAKDEESGDKKEE